MTLLKDRVANWMREQIDERFPIGESLLSQGDLLAMYINQTGESVSRVTFREGLRPLQMEGLLVMRQGLGTTVVKGSALDISAASLNRGSTSPLQWSGVKSFGTADKMGMLSLGDRVQLELVPILRFDYPSPTIVLTKFPTLLVSALTNALMAKERVLTEFSGQNYCGRTGAIVISGEACLYLMFDLPIGCLVHMDREEMSDFKDMVSGLPVLPHPTD